MPGSLDQDIRNFPAPQANSAIALLLGAVIIGMKPRWGLHFLGQVGVLRLEFLQADDVGVLGRDPEQNPFAPCRANAVEI